MLKGNIIYLEGTSSSGKTTLAKTLQARLPKPFFYLAGDTFWDMVPGNFVNGMNEVEIATISTIKLFSDIGIDVIVDIVPLKLCNAMDLCLNALHECPVLYVCVTCPLDELCRREKERGDRRIGTGESQLTFLSPQDAYDLVIDTHNNSKEACADKIIELLGSSEQFTAFNTLWSQRNA